MKTSKQSARPFSLAQRLAALALGVLVSVPLAQSAVAALAQGNSVWTVHVGDPKNEKHDGKVEIEISYEYQDAGTQKVTGKKKVEVKVPAKMTQDEKQAAIVKAINDAAPKAPEPKGGKVYEAAAGLGNTVQVAPKPPTPDCTNAKIKNIVIEDTKTNERDRVQEPPASAFAVSSLSLENLISGYDDSGDGSVLSFESSSLGTVELALDPSVNKFTLLANIEDMLQSIGAQTLLLEDGPQLLVVLPEEELMGIGTNDATMSTVMGTYLLD